MTDQDRQFYKEFGQNLAQARKLANHKQETIAAALGLSRTSITNIENGRQPVQLHIAIELARLCNTTVTALLPSAADRPTIEIALPQLDPTKRSWVERVINAPTSLISGDREHVRTVQLRKKEGRRGPRKK